MGLVQCVWPHHQILAMTCINTGCIPSLTELIAKTSDNVNKSEGGQKQITPLQQHFYGVQCIFQHFAKKEIWDLW